MLIHFPFPVAFFSYAISLFMNRSQIPTGSILLYLPNKVVTIECIGLLDLN